MKKTPNFEKEHYRASKNQKKSVPPQICLLSFSEQTIFIRFYDRGKLRPIVARMKCLDYDLANLTLFAKKTLLLGCFRSMK